MLLKDPPEQPFSVQINSTRLDPGVNGFPPDPVGWEVGGLPPFLFLGRGRPWWLPVEPKYSQGKSGFVGALMAVPAYSARTAPGTATKTVSLGAAPGSPGGIPPPKASLCPLSSCSFLGCRGPEATRGWQPDTQTARPTNDWSLSPSRPLAPVLRPAIRTHLWPRRADTGPGGNRRCKDPLRGPTRVARVGWGPACTASCHPHPGPQHLRSAYFVLCLSGTWSSALLSRILWLLRPYCRAWRVCDLWSDGIFTVPHCPRNPSRVRLKALSSKLLKNNGEPPDTGVKKRRDWECGGWGDVSPALPSFWAFRAFGKSAPFPLHAFAWLSETAKGVRTNPTLVRSADQSQVDARGLRGHLGIP